MYKDAYKVKGDAMPSVPTANFCGMLVDFFALGLNQARVTDVVPRYVTKTEDKEGENVDYSPTPDQAEASPQEEAAEEASAEVPSIHNPL